MCCITSVDANKCFGCGACSFVCPKSAIKMIENNEGFQFPSQVNKCIQCGLCAEVCPTVPRENKKNEVIGAFAACLNDLELYSSSGGVFAALATQVIRDGDGIVYGAEMQSDHTVKHVAIKDVREIKRIQGSKYVQSDVSDTYSTIYHDLLSNKTVLFSGTPCQVSGVVSAMAEKEINTERLITIDLVCHGVPSPRFFREHIKTVYGNVSEVLFRYRNKHELYGFGISYVKNGKRHRIIPTDKDRYYACYSSHVSLRESCYNCPFASPERIGDITLGDLCKNDLLQSLDGRKAYSLVTINTEKGKRVFDQLYDITKIPIDYKDQVRANPQLHESTIRPKNRDLFYKTLFSKGNYDENSIIPFCNKVTIKSYLDLLLVYFTTPLLRHKIKLLIKK